MGSRAKTYRLVSGAQTHVIVERFELVNGIANDAESERRRTHESHDLLAIPAVVQRENVHGQTPPRCIQNGTPIE